MRLKGALPILLVAVTLVRLAAAPRLQAGEVVPYVNPVMVVTPTPDTAWLDYLNEVRVSAGAPPVAEEHSWSEANRLHARYMVKNDLLSHDEAMGNSWYTAEGDEAAAASNIWISSQSSVTSTRVVDNWLVAPFHGIALLDPQLLAAGYGEYREADGGIQFGAGIDVQRGITTTLPPSTTFPLKFPPDGAASAQREFHGEEFPDPLASCPGFTPPVGAPVYLQLGPGDLIPEIGTHIISVNGKPAPHCLLDETTYRHPDLYQESVGRVILDQRDAIILLPQSPLPAGATVRVAISANGRVHKWSFKTSD